MRHGVDFEHFRKALDAETNSRTIAHLPRPIIGFFGLIADWVDVDLMAHVAEHFSTGSFVVLGKATTDVSALSEMPNVHLLGRKPYADLPAYCKGFDVAMNPFRINDLTLNANPLKVREYLAAGLPVVSTRNSRSRSPGPMPDRARREGFFAKSRRPCKTPGPSGAQPGHAAKAGKPASTKSVPLPEPFGTAERGVDA